MRFKAKLAPEQVSLFYALLGSISKRTGNESKNVAKRSDGTLLGGSVLRLDSYKVRIISKCTSEAEGIPFFCELATTDGIFLDFRIDSTMKDNAIAMEVDLMQLRAALRTIVVGHQESMFKSHDGGVGDATMLMRYGTTIIKLAKRERAPCLRLEAITREGLISLHHSIPVRVVRVEEADNYLPPRVNTPDVQLELPIGQERPLRTIAERLKLLCPHVFLDASLKGELTLRSYSESTSVRTFFGKLAPRREGCQKEIVPCCLKVDTKNLVASLQWQQPFMLPNVTNALLCFIENEMLVLHVALNPENLGFFNYFVPVHILSEDEFADE